jgi:hypothetical protein
MTASPYFVIRNQSPTPLLVSIEPEAVLLPLDKGEEVTVHDPFIEKPVTLTVTNSDNGRTIISVWPGDGDVTVRKNGADVLDLIETAPRAEPSRLS